MSAEIPHQPIHEPTEAQWYRDYFGNVETNLAPDTAYQLPGQPLEDGPDVKILAVIDTTPRSEKANQLEMTGNQLLVVDVRDSAVDAQGNKKFRGISLSSDIQLLLLDSTFEPNSSEPLTGYKGIRVGEHFSYGRKSGGLLGEDGTIPDKSGRFRTHDTTSRNHFELYMPTQDSVEITSHSKNGTTVYASEALKPVDIEGDAHKQHIAKGLGNIVSREAVRSPDEQPASPEAGKIDAALKLIEAKFAAEAEKHKSWNVKHESKNIVNNARAAAVAHPENIEEITTLALENKLAGMEVPNVMGKWGIGDYQSKVARLLDIYARDPEVAKDILKLGVAGFHGTRSGSLVGIFEQGGLMTSLEARQKNVHLPNGEHIFASEKGTSAISFADWREPGSIAQYADSDGPRTMVSMRKQLASLEAEIEASVERGNNSRYVQTLRQVANDVRQSIKLEAESPHSFEAYVNRENFPVAFGVNIDDMPMYERVFDIPKTAPLDEPEVIRIVGSDIKGEFQIRGTLLSMDRLPIVAVPAERIPVVSEWFRQCGYKDVKVVDYTLIAH